MVDHAKDRTQNEPYSYHYRIYSPELKLLCKQQPTKYEDLEDKEIQAERLSVKQEGEDDRTQKDDE